MQGTDVLLRFQRNVFFQTAESALIQNGCYTCIAKKIYIFFNRYSFMAPSCLTLFPSWQSCHWEAKKLKVITNLPLRIWRTGHSRWTQSVHQSAGSEGTQFFSSGHLQPCWRRQRKRRRHAAAWWAAWARFASSANRHFHWKTPIKKMKKVVDKHVERKKRGSKCFLRWDEARGAAPHVSVLLPRLHVGPLGGHTFSPQHLRHHVPVGDGNHQLGPKAGFEYFPKHFLVYHLRNDVQKERITEKCELLNWNNFKP